MIRIAIIHAATKPARDLCQPQCGQLLALSLISFRHSGQVESATGGNVAKMDVFCQGNPSGSSDVWNVGRSSQSFERSDFLRQLSRRRRGTVPPELPRGSGDAALASPAVLAEFGKCPCLECRVWHRKTISFCL